MRDYWPMRVDGERILIFFKRVLALLLALVAAWLFYRAVFPAGPNRMVLVAKKDIPIGAQLGEGDVEYRAVPSLLVPDGPILKSTEVSGRTALVAMGEKTILTAQMLAPSPDGQRIVAISVDAPSAQLARPGSTVALWAPQSSAAASNAPSGVAEVEENFPSHEGKPNDHFDTKTYRSGASVLGPLVERALVVSSTLDAGSISFSDTQTTPVIITIAVNQDSVSKLVTAAFDRPLRAVKIS